MAIYGRVPKIGNINRTLKFRKADDYNFPILKAAFLEGKNYNRKSLITKYEKKL